MWNAVKDTARKTAINAARMTVLNARTTNTSTASSGDVTFSSTTDARTCCSTLDAGVTYYNNLVSELKNARAKISANWEGDAVAISDVLTRIDQVTATFEASLIPAMSGLSTSIVAFADEVDKVANNTVDSGSTNNSVGHPTQTPSHGAVNGAVQGTQNAINSTQTPTTQKQKPGFWAYHGNNFAEAWTGQSWADDWDYSGCDSGLDYVGAFVDNVLSEAGNVVDAAVDTVGAGVNFIVDGCSEILGWLFG